MSSINTTGMNLAQERLNVISNNIANANTVGFKSSTFNQTLASAASSMHSNISVPGATQSFAQGTITDSTNPFSLAINGSGVFQLDNNGIKTYTRDGQFSLNKEGSVVSATGEVLTGYKAVDGKIPVGGAVEPLSFTATASKPVVTTAVKLGVILNSQRSIVDPAAPAPTPADPSATVGTFDSTNPATYTDKNTSTVYDSLGKAHTLETFYTKTAVDDAVTGTGSGTTTWEVYATVDGAPGLAANKVGDLFFDASGALAADATGTPTVPPATPGLFSGAVTIDPNIIAPATTAATVSLDLTKALQYATPFGATTSQDGFPSGQMTSYSVGTDGVISAHYSTGNFAVVGQVALASFTNLNGLAPAPNNQWVATAESGPAAVGSAGSTALGLGLLNASAVEDSNVNLVSEMVNMISAQRAFQAQSSVIKTEDQNLQTIVGLKQ